MGRNSEIFTVLSLILQSTNDSNSSQVCEDNDIDPYQFYQFCLIPAVVLTLLMAATKPRRQKLLNFLFGRPGLVFPMDTLTRSSRLSYCCAYGAIGFTVYEIIWKKQFAIDYSGHRVIKVIVSVLIYGIVYFPVFTSLALGTAFSHFLGSIYIWMFFTIEIYQANECADNLAILAIILLRALPNLLCHAYLSIAMPVKFCFALREGRYFTPSLGEDLYAGSLQQIKKSFQGKHVTQLLQKPKVIVPPVGLINMTKSFIGRFVESWSYHTQSGFRYPSRLASVMFIAACVIYVICVELLVKIIWIFKLILDVLETLLGMYTQEKDQEEDVINKVLSLAHYGFKVLQVSSIVSVCVAATIIYLNMIHTTTSFRTNLFAMYRGDYRNIPSPASKSAVALCVGSIKYAGYQVAYIIWGFVALALVLFLICIVPALLITLLIHGYDEWLLSFLSRWWPGFVFAILFNVLQFLLSKYIFLQDRGKHLQLENRRFYFVFVYFMFFYNIFLGIISCVLRIIKALAVGLIFVARLDNSTLPRKFEHFDPGFSAYQGYIHMEAAHTNPVAIVFIRLLAALSRERKKNAVDEKQLETISLAALSRERKKNVVDEKHSETISLAALVNVDEGIKECKSDSHSDSHSGSHSDSHSDSQPVNVTARFKWYVTYTLLHNPALRIYRKGFMQSIKKARLEGLKFPISDMPITDFDM